MTNTTTNNKMVLANFIKVGDLISVNLSGYDRKDWVVRRVNKGSNTVWIDYDNQEHCGNQTIYPSDIVSVNGVKLSAIINEKIRF